MHSCIRCHHQDRTVRRRQPIREVLCRNCHSDVRNKSVVVQKVSGNFPLSIECVPGRQSFRIVEYLKSDYSEFELEPVEEMEEPHQDRANHSPALRLSTPLLHLRDNALSSPDDDSGSNEHSTARNIDPLLTNIRAEFHELNEQIHSTRTSMLKHMEEAQVYKRLAEERLNHIKRLRELFASLKQNTTEVNSCMDSISSALDHIQE